MACAAALALTMARMEVVRARKVATCEACKNESMQTLGRCVLEHEACNRNFQIAGYYLVLTWVFSQR